jgi:hypothetical protein
MTNKGVNYEVVEDERYCIGVQVKILLSTSWAGRVDDPAVVAIADALLVANQSCCEERHPFESRKFVAMWTIVCYQF